MGNFFNKRDFLKFLGSAAVAAPTAAIVAAKTAQAPAPAETTYERAMRTGTIRCGYTPYSIGFMKDPNSGKFSGIYYDIVTRLAQNLGLKIEWVEEVGWGEQIEGLNAKRYDMICSPVSLNSNRARSADFSIPLYYSPVHIWAKAGDQKLPSDIKQFDNAGIKISTLDGEQTSAFAAQFFPKAKQIALPQSAPFSDLVLQVTTGKADIVFAEPLAIHEFMQNNPYSLRRITPEDQPLLVVPNILLLPRGETDFRQMIDNGLREMFNSHLIDQAIDRYETVPGSYVRETTRR